MSFRNSIYGYEYEHSSLLLLLVLRLLVERLLRSDAFGYGNHVAQAIIEFFC